MALRIPEPNEDQFGAPLTAIQRFVNEYQPGGLIPNNTFRNLLRLVLVEAVDHFIEAEEKAKLAKKTKTAVKKVAVKVAVKKPAVKKTVAKKEVKRVSKR